MSKKKLLIVSKYILSYRSSTFFRHSIYAFNYLHTYHIVNTKDVVNMYVPII